MTLIIEVSCRGVDESRRLLLEEGEELVVGRNNEDVLLRTDQTLSRRHFALSHSKNAIEVRHLSKTNPTLMAPEGSSDFHRVTEMQSECRSCRIIAGAHRFVATIETLESATISGSIDEIWSDVDDKFENQELGSASKSEATPAGYATLEDFRIEKKPKEPVFTWEDSVDFVEPSTDVEQEEQPTKSKSALPNGPAEIPVPVEPAPEQRRRNEPDAPAKPDPPANLDEPGIDVGEDSFPDDFFD